MELKDELLKSFHEQFAQNQNHYQKLFFQILSVLVSVMVGYGYVYTVGWKVLEEELNPSIFLLSWVLMISTVVLGLSLVLLCNMAYGFRRDQYVNNKIRMKAKLIHNKNVEDDFFPKSYDPAWSFNMKLKTYDEKLKKMNFFVKCTYGILIWIFKRLSWMPNFHNSLYFMLYLIQILIFSSYIFNPFDRITLFDFSLSINWTFVITIIIWSLLNILILRSQVIFYAKLKKLFNITT